VQFKSNGEHENFYLQLKEYSPYSVVYLPEMVCDHHHVGSTSYENLRGRSEGWRRFARKWGLTQHLEIGVGLRRYDDYDRLESYSFSDTGHIGSSFQTPLTNRSFVRLWPSGYAAASESPVTALQRMLHELESTRAENAAIHKLNLERWNAMQSMEALIRQRDEACAAQGRMLDERWNAIQEMGRFIGDRDRRIQELEGELAGVYQSESWRITKPLRWIGKVARSVLRPLRTR
jgi:hypothetical protein